MNPQKELLWGLWVGFRAQASVLKEGSGCRAVGLGSLALHVVASRV